MVVLRKAAPVSVQTTKLLSTAQQRFVSDFRQQHQAFHNSVGRGKSTSSLTRNNIRSFGFFCRDNPVKEMTSPPSMSSQVGIVTGAGSGLGRAYALDLAEAGLRHMLLNDMNKEHIQKVEAEIKKSYPNIKITLNTAMIGADEATGGIDIAKQCETEFGKPASILINNAGILRDVSFAKQSRKQWDDVYHVHMLGTRNLCKAVWPGMVKANYGRIVNVASISGVLGFYGQSNYSGMKSAIIGFSKALSKEGAKNGIQVNILVPNALTAMTNTIGLQHILDAEASDPRYVAPMVTFLSHPDSHGITGRVFEASPGYYSELKWQRSKGAYATDATGDRVAKKVCWQDIKNNWDTITDFQTSSDPIEDDKETPPKMFRLCMKQENNAKL